MSVVPVPLQGGGLHSRLSSKDRKREHEKREERESERVKRKYILAIHARFKQTPRVETGADSLLSSLPYIRKGEREAGARSLLLEPLGWQHSHDDLTRLTCICWFEVYSYACVNVCALKELLPTSGARVPPS